MKPLYLLTLCTLISSVLWSHDKRSSLEFVENKAQWNENVQFRAGLPNGASVYLENDGFTFSFLDPTEFAKLHDLQFATREEQMAFSVPGHSWKLNLINSQMDAINGEKKKSYYHNYFNGQDKSTWSSHVGIYEMVNYSSIYEGIDLKVYSKNDNFKYDFIVAPGMDPSLIKFNYSGLTDYFLKDGNLVLETSLGEFIESAPYAFQLIGGKLVKVECHYQLSDGLVSYSFPEGYNEDVKLVIDPELIASTLSGTGGGSSNFGHAAAFDSDGNIFTGCVAGGTEYPVTLGAFQQEYGGGGWDVGISKLNPTGTDLLWATYIGGSSSDYPHSLISNNDQELYVYGSSASDDYPVTENAFQATSGGDTDIIISHLSFDGATLIGSTYLGGSSNDGNNANSSNYGDNYRGEIFVDYDNNPIISSASQSTNFPVLTDCYQSENAGAQDVVIVKLTPDLSTLLVSTYYGGPDNDMGYSIRTGTDGSIIIGGSASESLPITEGTYQTDFIGESGGFGTELDGFIAKFNAEGNTLLASTYFGTESRDQVFFLDLDIDENIYVFGQGGGDMPVSEDVYVNPNSGQFISKFSNDLNELLISTTVGNGSGNTDFVPDAFLVDNCSNIYISAYSASGNLETTDDALFTSGGFYLAVYEENLTDILFGTFYTENHVDGGTSRFDKNGIVYQGVCSGGGFNTTDDAWATDQNIGWDIGVFKISFDASGVNAAVAQSNLSGCAPTDITFDNLSTGEEYIWDFGDGNISTEFEPTFSYDTEGVYELTLIAIDSLSCNIADTLNVEVTISSGQNINAAFDVSQTNCETLTIEGINQSSGLNLDYEWDMGDGSVFSSENVTYDYDAIGSYDVTLIITDELCNLIDTISQEIIVSETVIAQINNDDLIGCAPLSIDFNNTNIASSASTWDFGDGSPLTSGNDVTYEFSTPGTYTVTLTVEVEGEGSCSGIDQTTTTVEVLSEPQLDLGEDVRICRDSLVLDALNPGNQYTWQNGSTNQTLTIFESGTYSVIVGNGFCSTEDEITIDLATGLGNADALIPNVFSPNGDNFNDQFRLDNDQALSASMQIYNRWGLLLHETTGTNVTWDGTINGEDVADGVYFYIIEVFPQCSNIPDSEHSGSVTLLR